MATTDRCNPSTPHLCIPIERSKWLRVRSSSTDAEIYCLPCTNRQRQTRATVRCGQCKDKPFCPQHWENHSEEYDEHVAVDLWASSDSTTSLAESTPPVTSPSGATVAPSDAQANVLKCTLHPSRNLEALCTVDQTLVCLRCVTSAAHPGHKVASCLLRFCEFLTVP